MIEQDEFKIRTHLINYLDIVVRGLISFLVIGIGLGFLLIGYFKMKAIIVFPVIFICSIIITPFLSRIRLGEFLLIKYENLLHKIFKNI